MPFISSCDDIFTWEDNFMGDPDFAEYGVVGAVAPSAQGNGALLAAAAAPGNGLHFSNLLQLDPLNLLKVEFCISLDEAIAGAGVGDGNMIYAGIQAGNYNTDPTSIAKSIFFRCGAVGSATKVIQVYAKDGTRTYDFATVYSLRNVPTRLEINPSPGWANLELKIDGKPIQFGNDTRLNMSGIVATDWMQPLVYMKPKATGQPTNNLRLHHWRFVHRSQRLITRPPSTM